MTLIHHPLDHASIALGIVGGSNKLNAAHRDIANDSLNNASDTNAGRALVPGATNSAPPRATNQNGWWCPQRCFSRAGESLLVLQNKREFANLQSVMIERFQQPLQIANRPSPLHLQDRRWAGQSNLPATKFYAADEHTAAENIFLLAVRSKAFLPPP